MFSKLRDWFSPRPRPGVHVAAFGKHPAWNDHIDDPGLTTDGLVMLKRRLYTQGIAENIDRGTWDKLPADHRLDGFAHAFVQLDQDDVLIGRMWSSVDGKGRERYPMIAAVEFGRVPPGAALATGLDRLCAMQATCRLATTPGEVQSALDQLRHDLHAQIRTSGFHPPVARRQSPLPTLAKALGDSAETALVRVLHSLRRANRALQADYNNLSGELSAGQLLRLPTVGNTLESLALWTELAREQLGADALLLGLSRDDTTWIDLIVGEPMPQLLFCVRAGLPAIPLTTDIPYTIDATLLEELHTRLGRQL